MGPNRKAEDRECAAAEAAAKAKRAEAERKAIADAQNIVAIWNARQASGRALWFYPTIGAAISCWPSTRNASGGFLRSTAREDSGRWVAAFQQGLKLGG
jgi:hypothetical protein